MRPVYTYEHIQNSTEIGTLPVPRPAGFTNCTRELLPSPVAFQSNICRRPPFSARKNFSLTGGRYQFYNVKYQKYWKTDARIVLAATVLVITALQYSSQYLSYHQVPV